MKSIIVLTLMVFSSFAHSATLVCEARDFKVTIQSTPRDIVIIYNGESTYADGIVSKEEVDLVALFPSYGEMTVYARIGQGNSGNYIFFKGQRNSVLCR